MKMLTDTMMEKLNPLSAKGQNKLLPFKGFVTKQESFFSCNTFRWIKTAFKGYNGYNAKSGTAAERADPKQTSFSRGFKGMSKKRAGITSPA